MLWISDEHMIGVSFGVIKTGLVWDGCRFCVGWVKDVCEMSAGWVQDGCRMYVGWVQDLCRMGAGCVWVGQMIGPSWVSDGLWFQLKPKCSCKIPMAPTS